MTFIRWFEDISLADAPSVGGKGANLGELVAAGLPVPPGFVITADAYLSSMTEGHVRDSLAGAPDLRSSTDESANEAERRRRIVADVGLSADVRKAVIDAYHELSRRTGLTEVGVAVRSSATAEDAGDTSFAGMHQTFTNVTGTTALCERVLECWCPRSALARSRIAPCRV